MERNIKYTIKENAKLDGIDDDLSIISGMSNYSTMTKLSCSSSVVRDLVDFRNAYDKVHKLIPSKDGSETVMSQPISQMSKKSLSKSRSCAFIDAYKDWSWRLIDNFAAWQSEQEVTREKDRVKEEQKKMREELDEQIRLKKRREDEIRAEEIKYFETQEADLKRWKEIEAAQESKVKERNMLEKKMRDEQKEFDEKKKVFEQKRNLAEDRDMLDRIAKEQKAAEKREIARKQRHMELIARMKVKNDEDQKRKLERISIEKENDLKLVKEALALAEAQAAQREAAIQSRLTKQKELLEKMKDTIGQYQQNRANEDAQRANKQAEESEARALETNLHKARCLRALHLETAIFLRKQMADKDSRKKLKSQTDQVHAAVMEKDIEEYERKEKEKQRTARRHMMEYKKTLDEHIELQKKMRVPIISEEELLINRQLIELIGNAMSVKGAELGPQAPNFPNDFIDDEDDNRSSAVGAISGINGHFSRVYDQLN